MISLMPVEPPSSYVKPERRPVPPFSVNTYVLPASIVHVHVQRLLLPSSVKADVLGRAVNVDWSNSLTSLLLPVRTYALSVAFCFATITTEVLPEFSVPLGFSAVGSSLIRISIHAGNVTPACVYSYEPFGVTPSSPTPHPVAENTVVAVKQSLSERTVPAATGFAPVSLMFTCTFCALAPATIITAAMRVKIFFITF